MAVLLAWNSTFLLNLPEVDEQHIAIVDKLNEVHESVRTRKPRSVLVRQWHTLLDMLRDHFATEERLMKQGHCPCYERHKSEHDYLLRMAGRVPLTVEATSLIREWLMTHLKGSDSQMAKELRAL